MTDIMKIESLSDPFEITVSQIHSQIMRAASDQPITIGLPTKAAVTMTGSILKMRAGIRNILREEVTLTSEIRERLMDLMEVPE